MKYLNENGDELYILHFPGKKGIDEYKELITQELNREIIISPQLSIISVMNQNCEIQSPLKQQCYNNNIIIYNTALNETEWCNTKKINYILQALELIKTPYVLILDGRDTLIVNNLDDNFILKYRNLNYSIVYNASPINYPAHIFIESRKEILSIKSRARFLNGGVCIGEKNALQDFYNQAKKEQILTPNNHSEQLLLRKSKVNNPLVGIDSYNTLFRVAHSIDSDGKINKINNDTLQFLY